MVVCDASFISLRQVLPPSLDLCRRGGIVVALVKPQFGTRGPHELPRQPPPLTTTHRISEARRDQIEEGGVVRDPEVREAILDEARGWLGSLPGWTVRGSAESPITGPAGNVEYLLYGVKD